MFLRSGVETPEGIYGNQAGSATECGAVALALLWTCILCLLIDLIAKWYVEHKNKNSGIKSRQQQTIDIEHHHPHHHHHHQHSFNRQPRVNALHGDTGKRPISTPMSFAEQQARYVQYGATETIPPIVAGRL